MMLACVTVWLTLQLPLGMALGAFLKWRVVGLSEVEARRIRPKHRMIKALKSQPA